MVEIFWAHLYYIHQYFFFPAFAPEISAMEGVVGWLYWWHHLVFSLHFAVLCGRLLPLRGVWACVLLWPVGLAKCLTVFVSPLVPQSLPWELIQACLLEDSRPCGAKPALPSWGHSKYSLKTRGSILLGWTQLRSANSGPDQKNYSVNPQTTGYMNAVLTHWILWLLCSITVALVLI